MHKETSNDNQNQIAINISSFFLLLLYLKFYQKFIQNEANKFIKFEQLKIEIKNHHFCEFLLGSCSNKKLKNFILFFQDNK